MFNKEIIKEIISISKDIMKAVNERDFERLNDKLIEIEQRLQSKERID